MKEPQEHIDLLIENYLLGNLSSEEERDFLAQVKEDPELEERLRHHQRIQQVIEEDPMITAFEKVVGEVVSDNRQPSFRLYWRIAASVVMAVGFSLFATNYFSAPDLSPPQLAQAYFEPLSDAMTSRDEGDSLASRAMTFYNQGDFKAAIPILEQLVVTKEPFAELYLAVAYMGVEDYAAAQVIWEKLSADNPIYPNTILWYAALTDLALDDIDNARTKIKTLAGGNSSFKEEASALLEQLD